MSENNLQIALLREQTGCSLTLARTALSIREGILDFAAEYIERRDLGGSMSPEQRYPRWAQYLKQKARV